MPDNGILIEGVTQIGYASRELFTIQQPRTYITSSYFGNLGFAYPTALGAKVARPDVPVVAISGDGGFLYNSQELATAVQYGINVVTIVFNDNAYGNVMRAQVEDYQGHVLGTRLHNPDFAELARSYGARGLKTTDAGELNKLLREALEIAEPTVIEVPVGTMEREF